MSTTQDVKNQETEDCKSSEESTEVSGLETFKTRAFKAIYTEEGFGGVLFALQLFPERLHEEMLEELSMNIYEGTTKGTDMEKEDMFINRSAQIKLRGKPGPVFARPGFFRRLHGWQCSGRWPS